MKYVVIVSHGQFAQGVHSVLDMMVGSGREDILSVSMTSEMCAATFTEAFEKMIEGIKKEDEIILLGDIQGGSPLTNAMNSICDKGLIEKTIIFSGVNVPLAMNAVLQKDMIEDRQALIDTLMNDSKDSISYLDPICEEEAEEAI